MIRIGIGVGEIGNSEGTPEGLVEQTKRAEADGFRSVWLANIFGMDAMTGSALIGRETSSIEIGTGVVPTYYRHPFGMAQQAMSTQAVTGNRFALGIGLSHALVIEGMMGLSWKRSYSHMCDYLAVLAPLIREGAVSFSGEHYTVNANLAVPGATPCPILVAALAPKMLALTGTVADGTITWMTGPATIRDHVVPRIREAAASASRPAPRVVVGLPVAVTDDPAAARAAAAKVFEIYGSLPSYRAMLDREGAAGPADVVIAGDADAVGETLERLGEDGATDFLAAPFGFGDDRTATFEKTREVLAELARRS